MDETGNVLMKKIGPLPLIVWVAGASGVVFLFLLMKGQSSANNAANNQTNQVSSLAPTEAEAFGTIEQQQQDVTNALTTLGNNQSALGGSMSTLTGIVTQQGADNAASFQNLVNGQNTIESGQTSAASAADSYYQSLLNNMTSYYNSLLGGINSSSAQSSAGQQALASQLASGQQSLASQLAALSSSLGTQSSAQYGQLMGVLTNPWMKAYYENNVLSTLTPQQQGYYWQAMGAQAAGQPIANQPT